MEDVVEFVDGYVTINGMLDGEETTYFKRERVPVGTRQLVHAKTGGRCWYCGRLVGKGNPARLNWTYIDHIVPVSRGGSNAVDNLVVACGSCNGAKKCRPVETYRKVLHIELAGQLEMFAAELANRFIYHRGQAEWGLVHLAEAYSRWLRTTPHRFWGECEGHEWSDYSI